jgi:hydroxyacylglutathione hydrolase
MQITNNVHAIKIPFQVKTDSGVLERFVYSYLITGENTVLIDSGVVSSEEIIFDYMDDIGLKPYDISLMVLTHSHPDHIGSAPSIKERSGCQVAAHSAEKSWIEDVELQAKERPVPNFHSLVEGSVEIDIILEDWDEIELGDHLTLEIMHTPGHSHGSISLLLKEEGVLFTGDAVPLKGDLPIYDDYSASLESIEKLKDIENLNWLLSSWGDPILGDNVYHILDDALDYLKTIHDTVGQIAEDADYDDGDLLEFTKKVLKELGIPEMAANPMVAQSFQANLKELRE